MNFGIGRTAGALAFAALVLAGPAHQARGDGDSSELAQRLNALERRVTDLEAARSFAGFMPDLAERFHVMHRAGEAGDWAVAAHELAEMRRLTRLSTSIEAERGRLMQAMMGPQFDKLDSAIAHGNLQKFSRALEDTIDACNSCHTATGADFVQVTLDAPDNLSMRHPHRLMMRDAPEGHHHGPQGEHMMHGGRAGSPETHERAPATPHDHGQDAPGGDMGHQ